MKRYKVIVNPQSGGGLGRKARSRIERLLNDQGLSFDFASTSHPGHAVQLAQEAVTDGYDVVVGAGGDGTANEVLNGLMRARQAGAPQPAMGILCAGRGNDFAHAVGVPADLESGVLTLARDQRRLIDVGCVAGGWYPQGRFFGNCVGVGFDAIGTIEVAKLPLLGGFLSFLIAVLKTIFLYYRAPLTTIRFDDQIITQPALMVSVMNGRRLGGGFLMAPQSELDDGHFDLCIAGNMSRARMFRMIPHFLKGSQATQDEITTGRASRISITAVEGDLPAQTDGEIICTDGDHLDIELLPKGLEFVCDTVKGISPEGRHSEE